MASAPPLGLAALPAHIQVLADQWIEALASVSWVDLDPLDFVSGCSGTAAQAACEWTLSLPSPLGAMMISLEGSGIRFDLSVFSGLFNPFDLGTVVPALRSSVFGSIAGIRIIRSGADVAPPLVLKPTPASQITSVVWGDLIDADRVTGQATIQYLFSRLSSSSGSGAAAMFTGVVDSFGLVQGGVAIGGRTDDRTPMIKGAISAALADGESVRIFSGSELLGSAVVNNTAKTWTFTLPALPTTSGTTYSITARVADSAGNLGPASPVRTFVLDTAASATTATTARVVDSVGAVTGVVASGARTDDRTPTISGAISAALGAGETLRIFNGARLLGSAVVNNTEKTWTFTPSTLAATSGTTYSITARVADAAGNLGPASPARTFVLDTSMVLVSSSATLSGTQRNLTLTGSKRLNGVGNALDNTIVGNSSNNRLFGGGGKDVLTGGGTGDVDVFGYSSLAESRLAAFDVITDFRKNDRILAPLSVESKRLAASSGVAASLSASDLGAVLTPSVFESNGVAAFTVAGQLGTFIAMNDAQAGFHAASDAVIFLRGYAINSINIVEFV